MTDHREQTPKKLASTLLTAKALNGMLHVARQVTADIPSVIERYPDLQDALLPHLEEIAQGLAGNKEGVTLSFESALEYAFFGETTEELAKPSGTGALIDADLPETVGQLEGRLLASQEYFDASIGQIEELSETTRQYASAMYAKLAAELAGVAALLSQATKPGRHH